MAAWVVHCGKRGQKGALEKFQVDSVAAIWWETGDLSQIQDKEELQRTYRDANNRIPGSWASITSIYLFVREIVVGDLIVTPSTTSEEVLIGRCQGDYEYWPHWEDYEAEHARRMNWLKKIPRSELSEALVKSINMPPTVYNISEHTKEISDLLGEVDGTSTTRQVDEIPMVRKPVSYSPWSESNITTLAQELLWQPHYLQEIIEDLQEKRQVIFYGPPGTGKTYVAREIANQCKLNGGDFEIVQFHPSYSYEDFVQGFRPKLMNGQPGFDLVDGPLRRIADKAKKNREATFILIIDELNRGNVAKVFGELYFLLEYRDEEVRLQYGGDGEGFSLPSNLWFICTMNTADRSIALMDAALRRRFYFARFFPNKPPIAGLLRRWLERENQDTLAADLVDAANKKLERDMGVGPSYIMRAGQTLDEDRVRRIWRRAVIPYIEEQFFGDEDKLAEFAFDRLKRQLNGSELNGGASIGETDTAQADDDTATTC